MTARPVPAEADCFQQLRLTPRFGQWGLGGGGRQVRPYLESWICHCGRNVYNYQDEMSGGTIMYPLS